jgi:hypothetical protein
VFVLFSVVRYQYQLRSSYHSCEVGVARIPSRKGLSVFCIHNLLRVDDVIDVGV